MDDLELLAHHVKAQQAVLCRSAHLLSQVLMERTQVVALGGLLWAQLVSVNHLVVEHQGALRLGATVLQGEVGAVVTSSTLL